MRRDVIRRLTTHCRDGAVLEVGCGAGALLHEYAATNRECIGLDSSQLAYATGSLAAQRYADLALHFVATAQEDWSARFDTLLALEVLEHIDDDDQALRQWAHWMKSDATLVLSVPANRRMWGPADEWAGHVRRYDRQELLALVAKAGFAVKSIECYGFPFANFLDRLSRRRYRSETLRTPDGQPDRTANNARSGVDRRSSALLFALMSTLPGRFWLYLAQRCQRLFSSTTLGTGFVVIATRTP